MEIPKYIVFRVDVMRKGTSVELTNITDEVEDVIFKADRKTEPSFKVDGIGDDDSTIHAIAHLQKVGWLQEHDRALTEPQRAECPFDDAIPCEWVCTEYGKCKYKPKTEPQTDCSWK